MSWAVRYNIKLDRELGVPELPGPSASLAEQRAAIRALRLLYPGINARLFSVRTRGETRVVLELKV